MKKLIFILLTLVTFVSSLAGCSNEKDSDAKEDMDDFGADNKTEPATTTAGAQSNRKEDEINLAAVTYTTVTEGFDWGPAITKVIIHLGVTPDSSTLSKDTFKVSSVREYKGFNYAAMTADTEAKPYIEERTVTGVYVSDANGKQADDGSYVTIEMQVGPDIPAGSPFNYDFSLGVNTYVDTSYIIELKKELKTADQKIIHMTATSKEGYQGNTSLIADDFDISGSYTMDDITLKYASYIPATASKEAGANPLIIWLHGAGEGGTDPRIAILGNKVVNLATPAIQSYFGTTGAYLLVPQSPTMWMDYDGKRTYNNSVPASMGKSYYTEALMGLIHDFVTNHPELDPNRIYIGGCSNGGYMTMNMITTYPDYFAAAYPVCEAFSNEWLTQEKLAAVTDLPIWFTHAKTDGTVPIYQGSFDYSTMTYNFALDDKGEKIPLDDFTNAAYHRLIAAGASDVHYSLFDHVIDTTDTYVKAGSSEPYEYMGHWSWIYTLNNECKEVIDGKEVAIFEWLSQKSK